MSKPRTLSQFCDLLSEELAWRVKEIADLKFCIRTSDAAVAKTLLRAAVPILYAHWEGYVKATASAYLEYLTQMRLSYKDLTDCFVALGARRRISELLQTKNAEKHLEVVHFFLHELGQRASLKFGGAIDTKSNLNSEVFDNIAKSIGVATNQYEARYNLVDERLVKRRNGIAHGQQLLLAVDECKLLADEVIQLLRDFNTDLYNLASTRAYRRAVTNANAAA